MRVLLCVALLCPLMASAAECTPDEAHAAEVVTDYLDSWENVHQFSQQFGHCMDGGVSEGAHDRMQQLWTKRWNQTPRMAALVESDPKFKEFVLRALRTEEFPRDAFEILVRNATRRCQPVARRFCELVKVEVRRQ